MTEDLEGSVGEREESLSEKAAGGGGVFMLACWWQLLFQRRKTRLKQGSFYVGVQMNQVFFKGKAELQPATVQTGALQRCCVTIVTGEKVISLLRLRHR